MSGKPSLSHLGPTGEVHMVDVSAKPVTAREARAEGVVNVSAEALELALTGRAKKGDVLATARIAGIMAAKKTSDLIPLCHPLALTKVSVDIEPVSEQNLFHVESLVRVTGQTGVEMEALTGRLRQAGDGPGSARRRRGKCQRRSSGTGAHRQGQER